MYYCVCLFLCSIVKPYFFSIGPSAYPFADPNPISSINDSTNEITLFGLCICKSSSFVIEVMKSHDNATVLRITLLSPVINELHDKEAVICLFQ